MNFIHQQNLNNNQNINENIKIIYGIIGGIQTIINILTSFLDVLYFFNMLKIK